MNITQIVHEMYFFKSKLVNRNKKYDRSELSGMTIRLRRPQNAKFPMPLSIRLYIHYLSCSLN